MSMFESGGECKYEGECASGVFMTVSVSEVD